MRRARDSIRIVIFFFFAPAPDDFREFDVWRDPDDRPDGAMALLWV